MPVINGVWYDDGLWGLAQRIHVDVYGPMWMTKERRNGELAEIYNHVASVLEANKLKSTSWQAKPPEGYHLKLTHVRVDGQWCLSIEPVGEYPIESS